MGARSATRAVPRPRFTMTASSDPTPLIRTITVMQPLSWLALAWRDMARAGWVSFAHGLVLTLLGGLIMWVAHDRFWLLAGALSGFLVVAPVLATSLYALSRALERGERPSLGLVWRTWTRWQQGHVDKWSSPYWCLVQFGVLLALAATGWVLTSAALITLLAPVPVHTPVDFLRVVVADSESGLFALWLALGGFLAAPIFASSVVSIPMLLDRRITLMQAVLTSWRTVLDNPIPMAVWAALIAGFTLLGLGSFLLGLIAVMPMLGHASWHAYRDLVDASALPLRDAAVAPVQVRS